MNITTYPASYALDLQASILVSFMFLKVSLVSALIILAFTNFKLVKPHAVFCLVLYAVYTSANLMVEFGVIPALPWF
jgi:Ca2+/Na+ antiporter